MTKKQQYQQRGFVLIMVLVILVLAGTCLSLTVRQSCRQVLQATELQRELQQRWGFRSISDIWGAESETRLQNAEYIANEPLIEIQQKIELGGFTFYLTVSDEQAKANINALAEKYSSTELKSILMEFQMYSNKVLPVELNPLPDQNESLENLDNPTPSYQSFNQVFTFDAPSELTELPKIGETTASLFTCWGNGKLNFKRAKSITLKKYLQGSIPAKKITELLEYRDNSPDGTLIEAIKSIDITQKEANILTEILTDFSQCHSLWIKLELQYSHKYRFFIIEPTISNSSGIKKNSFDW